MTTTKEYRTELRNELAAMDGAEKLRAIAALREYVALADADANGIDMLRYFARYVHDSPTIVQATRLPTFLGKMVPLHREAEDRSQVEATLDAMEDMLQDEHHRRRAARGATT
jgi:hypothetical protein